MRKIKKECWCLDYSIIVYLNKHLKVYKNDASRNIDLTYHKFKYGNEEYTQLDIINELIDITTYVKEHYYNCKENEIIEQRVNKMYDLLKLIHFTLWW